MCSRHYMTGSSDILLWEIEQFYKQTTGSFITEIRLEKNISGFLQTSPEFNRSLGFKGLFICIHGLAFSPSCMFVEAPTLHFHQIQPALPQLKIVIAPLTTYFRSEKASRPAVPNLKGITLQPRPKQTKLPTSKETLSATQMSALSNFQSHKLNAKFFK